VIGLEVHVQLATRTKIFCACANEFGAPPNTNVCPVCLGLPGALPVLNAAAVEMAVAAALALECRVAETSIFARKHYFYPDLPKGFQISQYDRPLAEGGAVPVELDGGRRSFPLVRIHLEEDAGKSLHAEDGPGDTRLDLNRCGTPLIEIVSEPALRRPEEAGAYLTSLRQIVRYLGVSDGDMSQGSLRCDANVSVRRAGETALGVKTEVKNLNSIKAVERAIAAEAARQIRLLEGDGSGSDGGRGDGGGRVEQITLLWDEAAGDVRPMRSKEHAHDYRYFPEPDLMPLTVDPARREEIRRGLPELPFARRDRLERELGIPGYDAGVLTASRALADWFEELARLTGDAKTASNWTMGEVLRVLKDRGGEIESFPATPAALAELIALVKDGTVSGGTAKEVFDRMVTDGRGAREIVEAEGLAQISDEGALEAAVEKAIADHPGQVEEYRAGKEPVLGFLVGQVMKATRGKANPKRVNELLRDRLRSRDPA
jgi:aspartyl-tRNA(Asn)/glutamyl-tRNA(Gln) amidotransferase subunit B